ncbi:FISUMP domain-containing protein [uncultured Fibrobacter sp.]|uniref:FISUMP domain-containing protein n=1 Tax=uncultured Fibrobacter sp. TaxID=261512 RepID=UPI0026128A08|nr:FISUMP domain-containing protein [uncultured Fibrobacter sp.]
MKKGLVFSFAAFLFVACGDTVENVYQTEGAEVDFSCTTKPLKDSSGVKIICNGDSIGVVLNGKDGEKGAKGDAGKNGKDGKDGKDGKNGEDGKDGVSAVADTIPLDTEAVAVSLDSLAGYTQKGPFTKGSTVYLYELTDGRTLKQTNGNFTSNIVSDDGRYKFTARDLTSQYALLIVDGYYRNEVTGAVSGAPIRLKAISNMLMRRSANVNLLTHLEFERVYLLVTKEKMTVRAAKKKAQAEIFKLFHIDSEVFKTESEDLDVFGSSDADAALLAISILLQGNRTEAEMMALLTEISNGIAEKGEWIGERADSMVVSIADWAFTQNLAKIRKNVEGWKLSESVGNFEKYINHFIASIYEIEACSDKSSESQTVANPKSLFHGKSYQCYQVPEGNVTWVDVRPKSEYLNPDVGYETLIDWRDRRMYYVHHERGSYFSYDVDETAPGVTIIPTTYDETYMAENLDFEYRVDGEVYGTFCHDGNCDSEESKLVGRHYSWAAAMDSAGVYSDNGSGCGFKRVCSASIPLRGICPEGWHLPDSKEWTNLINYAGYKMGKEDPTRALLSKKFEAMTGKGTDLLGFSTIVTAEWFGFYIMGHYSVNKQTEYAAFWSPDEISDEKAGMVGVGKYVYGYDAVAAPDAYISKPLPYGSMKSSQINIRCFKDK